MSTNKATIEALQHYLSHPSPHIRNRAAIILHTLDDKQADEISNTTGISLRTVKKWQDVWNEQGLSIFPNDVPQDTNAESLGNTGKIIAPPEPVIIGEDIEAPELNIDSESTLSAADSLAEAGRKIMLEQLQQMVEQEPDVRRGKDSEAIHQMRIATRRWRSVYTGFGSQLPKTYTKQLQQFVQQTAKHLGQVRDLDVFLEKTRKYIKSHENVSKSTMKPLLTLIKDDKRKARKNLSQWLDNKTYTRFVKRASKRLNKSPKSQKHQLPLNQILPEMISDQFEIIQSYDDQISNAPIKTLHNLRIECKAYVIALKPL